MDDRKRLETNGLAEGAFGKTEVLTYNVTADR
jgi:hypothetical protein